MRITKFFENSHVTSPYINVVITFLFAFSAATGSIYSVELRKTSIFNCIDGDGACFPDGSFSPHAVIFWTSLLIGSVLFFFRNYYQDRKQEQSQDELVQILKTAPSKDFMDKFVDLYTIVKDLSVSTGVLYGAFVENYKHTESIEEKDELRKSFVESVELNIRRVLDAIIDIFMQFEGISNKEIVGANIMIFLERDKNKENEVADIKGMEVAGSCLLPLFFGNTNFNLMRGYLVGFKKLSTSSKTKEQGAIDESFPDGLCLYVPKNLKSRKGNLYALPGAPEAFLSNAGVSLVPNTNQLEKWFLRSNFEWEVKEEVKSYFSKGDGEHIKSFLSFAIEPSTSQEVVSFDGDGEDDGLKHIAVMNIHTTKTTLREATESPFLINDFLKICSPFVAHVIDIWYKLMSNDYENES